MELWIRSQYKTDLVKVNEIFVNEAGTIFCNKRVFACYSKKRALEILDEIQFAILCSGDTWEEAINYKEMIKSGRCSINVKTGAVIYEMPEDKD